MEIFVTPKQRSAITRKFIIRKGELCYKNSGHKVDAPMFSLTPKEKLSEEKISIWGNPEEIVGDTSKYPKDFAWYVLCGLSRVDMSVHYKGEKEFCGYQIESGKPTNPLGGTTHWWCAA